MAQRMTRQKLEASSYELVKEWRKVAHLNGGVLTLKWVSGFYAHDDLSQRAILILCHQAQEILAMDAALIALRM